jgi:hypothetical protein
MYEMIEEKFVDGKFKKEINQNFNLKKAKFKQNQVE